MSICSDLSSDHANASSAGSVATAEESAVLYVIEVDSPFFQLSKDTVLLTPEPMGNGGGMGSSFVGSNGSGNGMTSRNTARGVASTTRGAGLGGHLKKQNLPKRASLVDPASRHLHGNEASPTAGTSGESAEGSGPVNPTPLPETNAALLNFYPRAAGSYPCRILVMRRMKYVVDVRCVDIAATVDAPRNATTLVFRAPAGQTITQEVRLRVGQCTVTDPLIAGRVRIKRSGSACVLAPSELSLE